MTEARPSKANERPVYRLLLRPEPGVDAERALRWLLKNCPLHFRRAVQP